MGHNYQRRTNEPSPFDRNFWSKVYAVLGSELPLLPEDADHLIARGLGEHDLKQFRSLHPDHNDKALRAVQAAFKGRIWDVPGIVRRPDRSAGLVVNRGILIPLIDPASRIMAFQVRTGVKGSKYVWLTRQGVVGKEVHFARRPVTGTWVITEGPLKAQVAQALLGRDLDETVIGLGGVGNWQSVVSYFADLRPTSVTVALDMDKAAKPGVQAAEGGLITAAKKAGVPQVAVMEWDPKYKGLDDALAAVDSCISERVVS